MSRTRADDERVDEEADEALGLGARAARDRCADGEVASARSSGGADVERRQQRHEERDALAARELAERVGGGRGGARKGGDGPVGTSTAAAADR